MFAPDEVGNERDQRAQVHPRAARAERRLRIAQHKGTRGNLMANTVTQRVNLAPKATGREPNPQPD